MSNEHTSDIFFKIDAFVESLEAQGYDFDEVLEAIAEYIEISEELL
jgi:hypothetical protein